ncbi:MAG: tetratricopeptide repeat protein [Phycisphaerae bacterium]|nr:tetratricopeptide repeat protein [Phycisphaerae bacterium]
MRRAILTALLALIAVAPSAHGQAQAQLVPDAPAANEAVATSLNAAWLTDDERRDLRVFHGLWDGRDLDTAARRAMAALTLEDWSSDVFGDSTLPAAVRAEALLGAGRFADALALVEKETDPEAVAVRCEALAWLGRTDDAIAAAVALDPLLDEGTAKSAGEIVAAARAAMVRGRLEPRTTADWQRVLDALGRARSAFDRLYWPAVLTEAEILVEKHHYEVAIPALHQVLSLQPRSGRAWRLLGELAIRQFDFDSAERAVTALNRIRTAHPSASILSARLDIARRDPDRAIEALERAFARGVATPEALALRAAASATQFDETTTATWLAAFEKAAPGHPLGAFIVGETLADLRQYDAAALSLEEAIRRWPNWADPRIALGALETQTGRDEKAREALTAATRLDPFDQRAQFFLLLLDELASYARIESEHFIIRYQPGRDEVLAKLMPDALDAMHKVVATRFGHEPERKTVIDLMPDHPKFAVRITGMPRIHTIAACTGPVIAIEVSREGPRTKHLGTFDWLKVLRHEYTHTITLSQTKNRIPHWLTEAAAVSMELTPRDYSTCQMLARELATGGLFTLDTINWGFIRPTRPHDRPLAYAQGAWMVQYMNERFGPDALVKLLDLYAGGMPESRAMPEALGVSRAEFERGFFEYAKDQVRAWGFAPEPSMEALMRERRDADPELRAMYDTALHATLVETAGAISEQIGRPGNAKRDGIAGAEWPRPRIAVTPPDDATLAAWLERYPDHPDVLELSVRSRMRSMGDGKPDEATLALLERYAKARPVDPYPHRLLAKLYLTSDDPSRAIPHLAELDIREEKENAYAIEIARLRRDAGDTAGALTSIERAVRINAYDPALRELAAAMAVEAARLDRALVHIEALTVLEPDAVQHRRRLERVKELMSAKP